MLTVDNAASQTAEFIASIAPYPGHFHDRGIVTCAGGVKYLACAWVQINMLRCLGCTLPIELWYLGEDEGDRHWIELVRPLGVECVNAFEVRQRHPHPRLAGWQAKAYAILHSRFQHVLFLDADNLPVVDPTFLFDLAVYRQTGAIFWPDSLELSRERSAWHVFDVPYRKESAFESGQLLVDKQRCWPALRLCNWYNQHSDFFYQFVYRDKETFHFAWNRLAQPFTLVPFPPEAAPFGLIQFGLKGERLFQHRLREKWLLNSNRPYPGFWHEDACHEFVRRLAARWDPALHLTRHLIAQDRLQMQLLAGKTYRYIQVGGRSWPIQLCANGRVAAQAGLRDSFWWCSEGRLVLAGADGRVTAILGQLSDGSWRGRSQVRGKEEVRLVRTRLWSGSAYGSSANGALVSGEGCRRFPESFEFAWPGFAAGTRSSEMSSTLIRLPGRCFNPSLIRHQGRMLFAYRKLVSETENDICLVYLDESFQPAGEAKVLDIPPAMPVPSCWEDPRLFYFRDRLFCSFTYWAPSFKSNRTAVGVCELGPDLVVRSVRYPRYGSNHNACTGGKENGQEKNWVWFEHQERLYFIYDTVPFEVVEYDYERDSIRGSMRTYPETKWSWGKIRGGTPPLRVGDRYYSFFHSWLPVAGRLTYYAGVLTFLPGIPFRLEQVSAQPLLLGQWERGCEKSVIFPGGALYKNGWIVACGVNDKHCAIFKFSDEAIQGHLQSSWTERKDSHGGSFGRENGP